MATQMKRWMSMLGLVTALGLVGCDAAPAPTPRPMAPITVPDTSWEQFDESTRIMDDLHRAMEEQWAIEESLRRQQELIPSSLPAAIPAEPAVAPAFAQPIAAQPAFAAP